MGNIILDHFENFKFSTKYKKIPKTSLTYPKLSQKVPKLLPNMPNKKSKQNPKTVSVGPGIEPGTLRIRLPDRSEDQPIGLISSPERGSVELAYVPNKRGAYNNLVSQEELLLAEEDLRLPEEDF